jgi:Cu(I)/Ag(I) efflux system membrane fusion protein
MADAPSLDVLYWYDPMVPQQHFDKPGKSPFMDMQLVPRYAREAATSGASATVTVSRGMQQNLGLRLANVERISLGSRIEASGLLSFNERDVAIVQSRVAGFVARVWPLAPGDRVKEGGALVEFVTPEWTAAQQEFLAVKDSGDSGLIAAGRDRLRLLGMDDAAIHGVEADGVAQSRFVVRAPIGGVVQALDVRAGMTVMPGQTLVRINGLSVIWLEVAVPEVMATTVHVGDAADVRLVDAAGVSVKGRVSALLPALSEATRTLRVRIELANPDAALRPGQSAQVTLISASQGAALAVPTEAVIRTGKRSVVMLAEQGDFRPVEVTLGREVGDKTVVTSGLSEGQQVVASGQFLLDSEASLRGLGLPAKEEGK